MPSSPETETEERDLQAELAELDDRYKRALADLDNYRKRVPAEIQRQVDARTEAIARDWLEAVDSVERALRMGGPEKEIAAGLRAVLEQMETILERQGLQRIGAPGERFDPELHEAVGVRGSDEVPDRTILELARTGYGAGDKVLRPAQVVVSQGGGERQKEGES